MPSSTAIQAPIATALAQFQTHYDTLFTHTDALLGQVLSYVRSQQGKRMRPTLVLLTAQALGQITQATLHAAATLELLHTASLVHDDVIDEAATRRGHQAVHTLFDNKAAVLVGDYMLSLALGESARTHHIEAVHTVAKLGQMLSQGELLQLENLQATDFSEDRYFRIIREKTAVLFNACLHLGALTSRTDLTNLQHTQLEALGLHIGTAFQIRDDIFDYHTDDVGKPTGNDMQEGKLTLPAIYVINQTNDPTLRQIGLDVRQGEASPKAITTLVEAAHTQGGIAYAEQCMHTHTTAAHALIDTLFNPNQTREALHAFVDHVATRNK
ncbi:MAG: polyprenyl synthetase family protein [Bacteroidales bacterium]|nr:polyprenyl synthetase family protein [Bacteroidales bacterium]